MNVEIRPVTTTDVPAVVRLVKEVLAEFGITFGAGSDTDEQLLTLPGSYTAGGGLFLVALRDGELVGTAGVYAMGAGEAELRKMYLVPAARGLGLGRALLERSIAHARAMGVRRLTLDTTERMVGAIALYERAGFVRDDAYCRASRCQRGYRLDLE